MAIECQQCGKKDVVLFPLTVDGMKAFFCAKHYSIARGVQAEIDGQIEEHDKEYSLKWKLKDENGQEFIEHHENMTCSDFEVLYGTNTMEIVWIMFGKKNKAYI